MKTLSLIVSSVLFLVSGYFLVTDFTFSTGLNYFIYISLLIILMLVGVVGIMINLPMIIKEKRRMKSLIYNSYSKKRVSNKSFDRQFEIL